MVRLKLDGYNVSDNDIQIPDEPNAPTPPADTPYRNLWVPLIVVPAGIVIAIVLIFALFGALSGDESSIDQNLEVVVRGGKNQREQALFSLARQASENVRAQAAGDELPWPVERGFDTRLKAALEGLDDDDHRTRLALAVLLASVDQREGVPVLLQILALPDTEDPGGELRFSAIQNLGQLGDERATEPVLAFLGHEDKGLRNVAAFALQKLPGPGVRDALEAALNDSSFEVRGTAALSLTKLEPPSERALDVLWDLLDRSTYAAINERDRTQFRRAELISASRVKAVEGLARMGALVERSELEALTKDEDVHVAEAALKAIAQLEAN